MAKKATIESTETDGEVAQFVKGISKMSKQDLEDLKRTLVAHPHLEVVHFTVDGKYFFNTHELQEKGKKTAKSYGFQRLVPTVSKVVGERKFFKNKSVHTPEAEIVNSLTADEVLDYEWVEVQEELDPIESLKQQREANRKHIQDMKKSAELYNQ